MPAEQDEHLPQELRECACHLMQHPLTCKEQDPDIFRLILRHEGTLDRLFTQRLGYRLHVAADTARLYKTGFIAEHRALTARKSGRAFHPLEYVLLALLLGATVAGPGVISLRDLVERVRSAAVEAGITLEDSQSTRRSLVTALQWMIDQGLAQVLHALIDTYVNDSAADAVIKLRPDRIAMLPLPALAGARDAAELADRSRARVATRQWMRCRLAEDPVLYRTDLTEEEWHELRRRIGEEARYLEEMFGLILEVRAEGVAAIDTHGDLSETPFPTGGTAGHAALLLIERMHATADRSLDEDEITAVLRELSQLNSSKWSNDAVRSPEHLVRPVLDLLLTLRLAGWQEAADRPRQLRLLPAAGRFLPPASAELAADRPSQLCLLSAAQGFLPPASAEPGPPDEEARW
jgi:uncharacterized protein (TIGR02678 family)